MPIFDRRNMRRTPKGNESGLELDELSEIRDQVPEIDSTLDRLDQALASPMEEGGCGCWG